ncbi:phytanoyl-CoA dioxygenase family protein [Actinomadura rubrisoli]|nr:phytanoyl-CoA dioxygenase family protein [Actinomadura rubrisoli]
MSEAEQVRHLEVEGFVVIPDLLSAERLREMRRELAALPTEGMDYSEHQRSCVDVQWTDSPSCIAVIGLPEMVGFLERLFGDELICTSSMYAVSRPGHPGMAIHTDAQPYGSRIFGPQASAPKLVRVLYYLDDLTPEHAPLKVVPHSHLSLHADANPYRRYLAHPEEVMVTCRAGSAAIINQSVFHANYPNTSETDRELFAIAYRPAWAGPIAQVEEWPAEKVAGLPEHVRRYFGSLNTRKIDFDVRNRSDDMATTAPGINPSRWDG